ncbi:MAG: glutathione S-transferase, partial [Pseudomonadota bacterium]|nr:glutathione S-transferase [Pseudomonadota bacterium]
MSKAILYSFRRCPYAMRARMAIASSGMQVILREVSLRDKPQSLLDISSKATVPVLLTPEKKVIDESLDIMLWALRQSDPSAWLNNINYALIENNDGPFKQWLDRYKYADRYPEHTQQFYREQGEQTFLILEHALADSAFLSGNIVTMTDIAIFPFIRQFVSVEQGWFEHAPYPNTRRWLDFLLASELFQKTMHKYSPWK